MSAGAGVGGGSGVAPGVPFGVLVMDYGTPRDRADIERYYTDIRRGRPPAPEQLAELTGRYDALGGTFPLREISSAQAAGLQAALDRRAPGRAVVGSGHKHTTPRVEDAVADLAGRGVRRVVGLVLAPHYSAASVGEYAERAAGAAAALAAPVRVDTVPSWNTLPAYVTFLAAAVRDGLAALPDGTEVVFTAHSLPVRVAAGGDPYPTQLAETAAAVAAAAGLRAWSTGWQSAGRTPEPWLGPDVLEVLRDRAAAGAPGVLVCACGFVADHLEVGYDLDIEAAALAAELGLPFGRTRSVNADPAVLAGLADLVLSVAAGDG